MFGTQQARGCVSVGQMIGEGDAVTIRGAPLAIAWTPQVETEPTSGTHRYIGVSPGVGLSMVSVLSHRGCRFGAVAPVQHSHPALIRGGALATQAQCNSSPLDVNYGSNSSMDNRWLHSSQSRRAGSWQARRLAPGNISCGSPAGARIPLRVLAGEIIVVREDQPQGCEHDCATDASISSTLREAFRGELGDRIYCSGAAESQKLLHSAGRCQHCPAAARSVR
ncbi:hypothetical protein KC325_g94 [Hortaea werneckii]|nr:hypothetical protein KC325_g94 [Hortaea werneckii]